MPVRTRPSWSDPLADELKRRGFHLWYDENNLQLGEHFEEILALSIMKSISAVAVISASFLTKHWTRYEIKLIGEKLRFVVLHGITPEECRAHLPELHLTRHQNSRAGVATLAQEIINSLPEGMAN
jgi:hypothetical protein